MDTGSSSSSSGSGSSSSSGSSSCTETGSSSDTESSSSVEDKTTVQNNTKQQTTATRRKSSAEFKSTKSTTTATAATAAAAAASAVAVAEAKPKNPPLTTAAGKVRAVAASNQRNGGISSDDDDDDDEVFKNRGERAEEVLLNKKQTSNATAKRKPTITASSSGGGGGKVAPKQLATRHAMHNKVGTRSTENGGGSKHAASAAAASSSSSNATDDSIKETNKNARKIPTKMATTATAMRAKQLRKKVPPPPKRPTATNTSKARPKSSESSGDDENEEEDNDDTESVTGSGGGDDDDSSSSGSESEDSDSSNSYRSNNKPNIKQKRGHKAQQRSDADEQSKHKQQTLPMRKLTRSLSMRHGKQKVKQVSDSDSDGEMEKHMVTKHAAKKPPALLALSSNSKCKAKKELSGGGGGGSGSVGTAIMPMKSRPVSPLVQLEKKCPIEGCDSSGHLSGNLDRHFLPEACPIYHNMSASECKERANERKQRNEQRQKLPISITTTAGAAHNNTNRTLTADQKEFLAKIRESRARFRPICHASNDKIKLEKDCTDEDREPNLTGLVPDYDLQLFREAQALASEKIEDELKDLPVGKGIKYITMGKYKMKVWYQSPYPDDAARLPKMYICEFCLRYQKSETGIKRHAQKCVWRHPPGDEIYRKGKLQVWQVDGKRYKQYCQHLCLLAKFFLDHKTLYYDVEPFLFYIMTLADVDGCHIVGYFSKEKNSFYNVSCILTLPPYQRKGYGRLLIDFSYLLTRVEGKIGSPEKPLSDLGLISYRSYWKDVLLDFLCNRSGNTLSIKDVSQEMAIYSYDIVSTLQALGMMKYWKGKHIVLKKQDVLDEYEERVKRRGTFPKIDDSCLRWQPFVPVQMSASP